MSIVSDFQKSNVYKAEDEAVRKLSKEEQLIMLTRDEAIDMVTTACKHENVKPPTIEFKKHRTGSKVVAGYTNEDARLVFFEPKGLRDDIAMHELAHHLTPEVFPYHGVEWVRTYLRLLKRWCDPRVEQVVQAEFRAAKVHMTSDKRMQRARRVAVNIANTRPGTRVNIVMDAPPQAASVMIVGQSKDDGVLVELGTKRLWLPWNRLRYLETV